MENMFNIFLAEALLPIIIFIAGFLVRKFIAENKNKLVFTSIIRLVEALLERFEVDVPHFLEELLKEMHKLDQDTSEYEGAVLDEINRFDGLKKQAQDLK